MSKPRIDLFSTIHKGLRAELCRVAVQAGRTDPARADDIDALLAEVERVLCFLREHAALEEMHLFPALRACAPGIAAALDADHDALEQTQREVDRAIAQLARDLVPTGLAALGAALWRLAAEHLRHMDREERQAMPALWAAHDDGALIAIRVRIQSALGAARMREWAELIGPALTARERALMTANAR